ncbi:MAG: peptide chain release factor N(5)-glutamine methyltransferase [Cyclobacteriaceae bacterium]|nr:peptide chain release factor N(5)-glutamine methyltransferase [Cyclobacteriaceae bacterium]
MDAARTYHSHSIFRQVREDLHPFYGRESESLSYMLLDEYLNIDRIACISDRIIQPENSRITLLDVAVERLKKYEPIQYILGKSLFYGREFHVSPGVLIPRQETEELIRKIITMNRLRKPGILDIGCGSGCIAVSLALEIPEAELFAFDKYPEAVQITCENALKLGAEVKAVHHDIFDGNWPFPEFDIIVSNPPYIAESEKENMSQNVTDYEPRHALFVPDEDPLKFYHRIAEISASGLKSGGYLFFEINESFGNRVYHLLETSGFDMVRIDQDIHGRDRFVSGRKK